MSMNRTCPISRRRFSSDSGGTTYLYIEAVPVTMIISPLPARGRQRWPCASSQTTFVIPMSKRYQIRFADANLTAGGGQSFDPHREAGDSVSGRTEGSVTGRGSRSYRISFIRYWAIKLRSVE